MWPDRVSNPGPPTYESDALPIALRGPAPTSCVGVCVRACARACVCLSVHVMCAIVCAKCACVITCIPHLPENIYYLEHITFKARFLLQGIWRGM